MCTKLLNTYSVYNNFKTEIAAVSWQGLELKIAHQKINDGEAMPTQISNQNTTNKPHELGQDHALSAKHAVLFFVLFLFFQFFFNFVLFFPLGVYGGNQVHLGHMNPSEMQQFLAQFNFPIGIFSSIASATIIFLMTKSILRESISDKTFASLGWKKASLAHTFLGLLVGVFLAAVMILIITPAFPLVDGQELGANGTASAAGGWQRFYFAVFALLVAPLIEEFLFRGVLFTGISNTYGVYVSAIIVSLLFVAIHIPEAIYYWHILIGISMLSIATILFRIKTNSLFPAIAVHFGYNLLVVITVYTGFHVH